MLWLSALLIEETDVAGKKDTIDLLQVTDMPLCDKVIQ
jgi:hypothetical protein